MKNPYKVFHSTVENLRKNIHVVLVRPENSSNIGSTARAIANMGVNGSLRIVGEPSLIDSQCRRLAKHAQDRLDGALFFPTLEAALAHDNHGPSLSLAATARVGSSSRPHPVWARTGVQRAIEKLRLGEVTNLKLVFGPESDGLSNAEVEVCDWVVTIPSSDEYRSLNLAQAILVFAYEANMSLLEEWEPFVADRPSQKQRLVAHVIKLAEDVGFVLPGDPFKMKPRLEEIFSHLPNQIWGVKTLHGLLDQVTRTVVKGEVDYKGRYKNFAALPDSKRKLQSDAASGDAQAEGV